MLLECLVVVLAGTNGPFSAQPTPANPSGTSVYGTAHLLTPVPTPRPVVIAESGDTSQIKELPKAPSRPKQPPMRTAQRSTHAVIPVSQPPQLPERAPAPKQQAPEKSAPKAKQAPANGTNGQAKKTAPETTEQTPQLSPPNGKANGKQNGEVNGRSVSEPPRPPAPAGAITTAPMPVIAEPGNGVIYEHMPGDAIVVMPGGHLPPYHYSGPTQFAPVLDSDELASWYGSLRSVYFWRTNATERPLLAGPNGASTDDLDIPGKWGLGGSIGWRFDSCNALETEYLWIDDATAVLSRTSDGALRVPFAGPGASAFNELTSFEARLNSKFFSWEMNCVHFFRDGTDHPYRLRGMIGPRIVGFEESLVFETARSTPVGPVLARYDGLIENTLYGGQVGIAGTFRNGGRLSLDGVLKAGVYGNETYGRQVLFTREPTVIDIQRSIGGPGRVAHLLEAGLTAEYQLRPGLYLTAGYQVLYAGPVGRGTDQIDFDLTHNVPVAQTHGDVFLHGLTLGIKLYWGDRTDPCCRSGCCTPYIVRSDCCP